MTVQCSTNAEPIEPGPLRSQRLLIQRSQNMQRFLCARRPLPCKTFKHLDKEHGALLPMRTSKTGAVHVCDLTRRPLMSFEFGSRHCIFCPSEHDFDRG